jgi:hypothetical protein
LPSVTGKIHLTAGRSKESVAVLEHLPQIKSKHEIALELLRQWQGR